MKQQNALNWLVPLLGILSLLAFGTGLFSQTAGQPFSFTTLHGHTVEMYGQQTPYHQIVSEPEPGRVIREQNQLSAQYTEFRLAPLADNTQTRVTIFSVLPLSGGIKGLIERWFQPGIVRTENRTPAR